jgi:hypothetical protein
MMKLVPYTPGRQYDQAKECHFLWYLQNESNLFCPLNGESNAHDQATAICGYVAVEPQAS